MSPRVEADETRSTSCISFSRRKPQLLFLFLGVAAIVLRLPLVADLDDVTFADRNRVAAQAASRFEFISHGLSGLGFRKAVRAVSWNVTVRQPHGVAEIPKPVLSTQHRQARDALGHLV